MSNMFDIIKGKVKAAKIAAGKKMPLLKTTVIALGATFLPTTMASCETACVPAGMTTTTTQTMYYANGHVTTTTRYSALDAARANDINAKAFERYVRSIGNGFNQGARAAQNWEKAQMQRARRKAGYYRG